MKSAPSPYVAEGRLSTPAEGSIEHVGRSVYRYRSARVPLRTDDGESKSSPRDAIMTVSVHDVSDLEMSGHSEAWRDGVAIQAFQKRQQRSRQRAVAASAPTQHTSAVAASPDAETSASSSRLPPHTPPLSANSVGEPAPMAAILLQWQLKCERLTQRIESQHDRVEALEAECSRLHGQAKEHEAEAVQWEERANRFAAQLEHHKAVYQLNMQERNGEHRAVLGELNMLKALREADLETASQLRRKVYDLEETLLRLRSRDFADASSQTDVLGDEMEYGDGRYQGSSTANCGPDHLAEDDANVVVRVHSLPRDLVQSSGRQQFMNHMSHTINTDPELAMALGSLFVAKEHQAQRHHNTGGSSKGSEVQQHEAVRGMAQYNAHRGLGINPFDDAVEYELEQHSPKKTAEASPVVGPKVYPKPAARGASSAMPSDVHRVFSPSPKAPTTQSEDATSPYDSNGPHLKALCFAPPQRQTSADHRARSHTIRSEEGYEGNSGGPGPRTSYGFYPQRNERRRDRKRIALQHPPPVHIEENDDDLLSPQLVSTVVSSASSSCGDEGVEASEKVFSAVSSALLHPPHQPSDAEFYDANPQQETERQPSVKAQQLVSIQTHYVKSPSPCQPSTPLPPTPSSQSPYRNRVSVERIEKLRHELQYLIDMRVRLQQP